jgi:hypothetical protein
LVVAAGARMASGMMARVVSFARVEGEEEVEFSYFVIVLFSPLKAATDAMEARSDI